MSPEKGGYAIMKMDRNKTLLFVLLAVAVMSLAPKMDVLQETKKIWTWENPKTYPQPVPGDLDITSLSVLTDSGTLQWYMPRPEKDQWDTVIAVKVHAPLEVVWKVSTDYTDYCQLIPDTLKKCEIVSRDGNTVINKYEAVNSVLNFEYKYEFVDKMTEEPMKQIHCDTTEGGLEGRQIDYYFFPVDNGENTLVFMRHYSGIKSLGSLIRMVLKTIPMIEWPVTASASSYVLRGFKHKSETISGYTSSAKPQAINYKNLDIDTLLKLESYSPGLIRETQEGKTINGLTYETINATPDTVWKTITDFEHYGDFKDSDVVIEKREGNEVLVMQKMVSMSILIFNFGGMEMHNRYILDPPYHMSFKTIDGLYEGSTSDYQILPIENGTRSILFNSVGLVTERDKSLTMRMVRSGAFPFNSMFCVTAANANVSAIKAEAERRNK
jgi:Polyketide cyclase / dehydrase and lipid transport